MTLDLFQFEPRRMLVCDWCRIEFPAPPGRPFARFHSKVCRQTAWRLRRRRTTEEAAASPGRFAYADPPYPGRALRYYGSEPTYAGEVDHRALVASLMSGGFMGWALSTSADALREVLPLCPAEARVCAWVKPIAAASATFGLHNTWEPVIVFQGRQRRPGRRDWFAAQPARGGGELVGRKPLAFCAFLFGALGMVPGDELVDLFPGSGVVGRAWAEVSRTESVSPTPRGDAVAIAADDAEGRS